MHDISSGDNTVPLVQPTCGQGHAGKPAVHCGGLPCAWHMYWSSAVERGSMLIAKAHCLTRCVSAVPQQSEICVKFSVLHTVFDVKFWRNFPPHTQTLENVARKISPKFHARFHDTYGREKRRKISLPHFCRVAALRCVEKGPLWVGTLCLTSSSFCH